jgi:hypothetical protein
MTKLVVSPSDKEQFRERPRYEDHADDLRALGFEVELEDPPLRHGATWDAIIFADLALYVGGPIASGVASALTAALMRRLGEKRKDGRPRDDASPRTVIIFGPKNEELRRIEIPERD